MTRYTYTIGRGTQKVFQNFEWLEIQKKNKIWKYFAHLLNLNKFEWVEPLWSIVNQLDRIWTSLIEFKPTWSIDGPTWPNVNHFESIVNHFDQIEHQIQIGNTKVCYSKIRKSIEKAYITTMEKKAKGTAEWRPMWF